MSQLFPEYYGGEMWSKALSNMGDNIAGAIEFYHKRHQENTATDAELGYLHDSGAIDDKAWERVTHARAGDKMAVEQGMLNAYKMKQQNDLHQAQMDHLRAQTAHEKRLGETSPMAGQYVYHPTTGAVIGQYDEKGTPHYFPKQAQPTEEQTEQQQRAEHPSQDPSLVIQKGTPAWHKTVNDIFEGLGLTGKGASFTGPFKVQPEIRKAARVTAGGDREQVKVGQPQGPPKFDIRSDPRVMRIKAAYKSGQMTKEEAQRQIAALGYGGGTQGNGSNE